MAERWPIVDVALDDLDLDLRNVRVPGGEVDDAAIARYLIEAADLLGLIRDILRDGYLDNEVPVVVVENGRHVVLEGNRRVTALKTVASPSLVGPSATRVERLMSRFQEHEMPTAIRVMIAPSWEAAQPLLARLHTGKPKRSWIREQQAIFFHAQLSPTVTVDDLKDMYPGQASKITEFIRMAEVREAILGLHFGDPDLEAYVKARKLRMSSLEYAYESPKIQKTLGLSFDKDGFLSSKQMDAGQQRGLMYLLGRFKAGTLNTRSLEFKPKSDQHEPFVELLRRIVAGEGAVTDAFNGSSGARNTAGGSAAGKSDEQAGGAGSFSGSGAAGSGHSRGGSPGGAGEGSMAGTNGGSQTSSRGPNRGETKSRLDMDGFEYGGTSAGMRRRFEELRRLDVRDYPNAAHDLLRTVLECAIKDYFRAKGQPLQAKQTIGPCIEALAKEFQKHPRMTALINSINRKGRMSAEQYAGTTDSLSASNHEPDHFAEGPDVHAAWERIKPILLEIVGAAPAQP